MKAFRKANVNKEMFFFFKSFSYLNKSEEDICASGHFEMYLEYTLG